VSHFVGGWYGYGLFIFGMGGGWWWRFGSLCCRFLGSESGWFDTMRISWLLDRFLERGCGRIMSLGDYLFRRVVVMLRFIGVKLRGLIVLIEVWLLESSCVICASSGSSSPARVYRRYIRERICARP